MMRLICTRCSTPIRGLRRRLGWPSHLRISWTYRRARRSCKRLPRANDYVATVALEHVMQTGVVGVRKLSGGWLSSTVAGRNQNRTSRMTRGVAAGISNKWLRVLRGPACPECDQGTVRVQHSIAWSVDRDKFTV